MSRYIDADALKQSVDECDVCNVCPERKARCNYDCEFPDHLTPKFEALIDAQPTIEPKRGKWVEVDDVLISCRCSVCGWKAHLYEDDVYGMPYCPNCGAHMKGADNE